MSIKSMKEDGVRREEVQGPLTDLLKLRDMRRINTGMIQVATWLLFCTRKKCSSVLWQWFCWWSGVALGHQGINVMSTSWTYPKFCPPMITNTSMPSMFNIRGFTSFFKAFFRRPNLNTRPKFEQCSCSLANLNWVLGLFPIDLVEGYRISYAQ